MMKTTRHLPAMDHRGFTLIELMVALLIGFVLVGGAVVLMDFSTRTYRAQERVADIQQEARAALDIMSRDLRMAGLSSRRLLANGIASIVTTDATTLRIQMDVDLSDTIDANGQEDITYTLSDGVIYRILDRGTPSEVSSPLLSNVSNISFSYRGDEDFTGTVAGNDTRTVTILLQCEGRDAAGGNFQRDLSTTVAVRNMVLLPKRGA
jgi:prepilin-type N-terminal cleavage/methylation domain-containing protein